MMGRERGREREERRIDGEVCGKGITSLMVEVDGEVNSHDHIYAAVVESSGWVDVVSEYRSIRRGCLSNAAHESVNYK